MRLLDLGGNVVNVDDNLIDYAMRELGFTQIVPVIPEELPSYLTEGAISNGVRVTDISPVTPTPTVGGFLDIEAVETMVKEVFWSTFDEDLASVTDEINAARDLAISFINQETGELERMTAQTYADRLANQQDASGWLGDIRDFASDQFQALTDFSYNPIIQSSLEIGTDALDLARQVDDMWAEFRSDVGEFQTQVMTEGFGAMADIVTGGDAWIIDNISEQYDFIDAAHDSVREGLLSLVDGLPDQVQAIVGGLVPSLDSLASTVRQALNFSPDDFTAGISNAFAGAHSIITDFMETLPGGAELIKEDVP